MVVVATLGLVFNGVTLTLTLALYLT